MKKLLFLIFSVVLVWSLSACDDTSSPPSASDPVDPLEGYTSETIYGADPSWDGLTSIDIQAWALGQFVDQAAVDALMGTPGFDTRKMYSINLTGSDGWSPRVKKGAPSMPWNIFATGYLLPKVYDAKAYWDQEDSGLAQYWLVKGVKDLDLYRSIILYITDKNGTLDDDTDDINRVITFETEKLVSVSLTYWNTNHTAQLTATAIKLDQILTNSNYVTTDSGALYEYRFTCADGYVSTGSGGSLVNNTCDYATFQTAYYIPGAADNEKIVFIDAGNDNAQLFKSVKWIVSINMEDLGSATGAYDSLATKPATADTASYSTSIPQQ